LTFARLRRIWNRVVFGSNIVCDTLNEQTGVEMLSLQPICGGKADDQKNYG
jgi:hypothetical protein